MAGTTTPAATYIDSAGVTSLSNPIILNSRGMPTTNGVTPATVWIGGGAALKFVLTDSNDVPVAPTFDNISGINDPSLSSVASEWVLFTGAPTYISGTQFSVQGDQTLVLQVGRRLRTQNTAGTRYGTITVSSYNAGTGLTTITLTNDTGTLDAGLSVVYYGFLSANDSSLPNSNGARAALGIFDGTFTPTVLSSGGGTPTYSTQYGSFTKIGGRVLFEINIQLATLGTLAAGNVSVQGTPFTVNAAANNKPTFSVLASNLNAGVTQPPLADTVEGTTSIRLFTYAAGAVTQMTVANLGATAIIRISGSFRAA